MADSPKNIAARSAKTKVLFTSDEFSGQQTCCGGVLHPLGNSTVRGSRSDMTNGWSEVESRITFEKANRLERKAHIFNWHHWKIFRSWQVEYTDRVPKHNVSIYQWPVLQDPFRQSGPTFVLAHILTWCM